MASTFANGRYVVERELGRGGMAIVLLARDEELGRRVAVKLLGEGVASDEEFAERFRREALTAASLSHANVVQVYDASREEGRPYIVMEYVEGDGLDAILAREGRLGVERVVGLAAQACTGLAYAHGRGVVHRDVKPANLLVRRDGVLKITDFGIARADDATSVTQVGTILGTASYVSPEQARGDRAGPASDLFSLGVVVYELLAGRPPWRIASLHDLAELGATSPPPLHELVPGVPRHVETAVLRSLAHDPGLRPASAAAFAAELTGTREVTSATVPLTGATPRTTAATTALPPPTAPARSPRERARTNRRVLLGALLAVVVLAAVFLALALRDDDGTSANPPARVEPVPRSDDALEQARNLREWIQDNSAG